MSVQVLTAVTVLSLITLAVVVHRARAQVALLRRVVRTAEEIVASGDASKRVEISQSEVDDAARIARAFNKGVERLEGILEAQRLMLADTSHELRNPLTVIRTNVDLLGKPLDEETRREVAEETEREIARLITLVEDLSLLSKTQSTPLRLEPVRLDVLARETVDKMRVLAVHRTLSMDDGGAEPLVLGNPERLRQVLVNLIGNALRYTEHGGNIVVSVGQRDDMGVVEVRDDGIGIAAEHLPRLFDRFYRIDSARARSTGGSGLGLAIVKALAEAHHGRVEVESTLGKGSVFRVFIPLEETVTPRITRPMPPVQAG
ncbi:MAG: hypothetical protein EB084_15525 [Proteobacteria bacterium]|nr:hypothetical protein [Pseudomonadota bacterium]